jgi:hypothetical protein
MTEYFTRPCEGCQGSGANWDCGELGVRADGEYCTCLTCTGDEACQECDGYGYYDPEPGLEPTVGGEAS